MRCTSSGMQITLDESNVFKYLRERGLLASGEEASLEEAGDGNINWVRRVRGAGQRSWVLKQARPALERFPEYRVTTERLVFEARYYEVTARFDTGRILPRVLHFDEAWRVLVLEDLGDAERLDHAFARRADTARPLRALATFLGAVHAGTRDPDLAERFTNGEMQRLHGDHIFQLPYRENEFPLSSAMRARAEAIWRDSELVGRIDAAYQRYLEPHGALVHADAQSGNVLLAERGPVLLDAEIAHIGDPAFDIGILLAHVLLPGVAAGDAARSESLARGTWQAYAESHGDEALPSQVDVMRYAGIELLRRCLGAARVPAVESDDAGLAVVEAGLRLVREPPAPW